MLDGGLAVADVGVFGQVTQRHPGMLGEQLPDHRQTAVEGVDHRVDLDPVAGGQTMASITSGDCMISS